MMADTVTIDELEINDAPKAETPDAPPVTDSAPRRRGRPPGSRNKAKGETGTAIDGSVSPAPRSRGSRGNRESTVRAQCASLVGLGNLALVFLAKDDALNEKEMDVLSDALAQEAMSSDRIMRWMTTASKVTPHIALASAVIAISVPRLQRRGILPASELTPEQEAILRERTNDIPTSAPETGSAAVIDYTDFAVPMGTG